MTPELVIAIVLGLPLERGRHREQCHVRRLRAGVLLDGLEVVEDPDRTTVRRDEHRVVARVDGDLVDAHGREVRLEPAPVRAAVEREEYPGLGADVEHVGVAGVLGEGLHDLAAQSGVETTKGRAEVGGHPDVRRVVVVAVIVDGDVRGPGVDAGGHDLRHECVRGKAGDARRDVAPGATTIARHPHDAVVGAGPEHVGRLG